MMSVIEEINSDDSSAYAGYLLDIESYADTASYLDFSCSRERYWLSHEVYTVQAVDGGATADGLLANKDGLSTLDADTIATLNAKSNHASVLYMDLE